MNTSTAKTRKTWLALLAAVATFVLALCMLSGCSSEKASDKTDDAMGENGKPILTVAMELAYPPFETKDEAGEAEGLSVDFMQDFADKYGLFGGFCGRDSGIGPAQRAKTTIWN